MRLTKEQQYVMAGVNKLRPLPKYQKQYFIEQYAPHQASYTTKKVYTCYDCGCSWKGEKSEEVQCPYCKHKLTVTTGRRRTYKSKLYVAFLDKYKSHQIIRQFLFDVTLKKGEPAKYEFGEVFQRWIGPTGKTTVATRKRKGLCFYVDVWDWSSAIEVRNVTSSIYAASPYLGCKPKVTSELKRNGFDGDVYDCNPHYLLPYLLTNSKAETIWKAGYRDLLAYALHHTHYIDRYWSSIKIAIRHNYNITDPSMWFDMLGSIEVLGKDLRNPKIVCPINLTEAHNKWGTLRTAHVAKIHAREARLREIALNEKLIQDMAKYEEDYSKSHGKYFGINIVDNDLTIKPLLSVKEFKEEGETMQHCVFTNRYFLRENVLILHALMDGKSIATIELNLESMAILQCRGVHNSVPGYHSRIIEVLKNNVDVISRLKNA